MGETEVRTAETSDSVTDASSQKSSSKASSKTSGASAGPTLNERGVPVTQWDNPEQDPNLRAHVGDSPDGADNKDFAAGKKALKTK